MGKTVSVVFFICVFFAVSSSAIAQQLQLQDTLKEVEVRSKSVSVNRSVTPVQVLSSSELEKLNSLSVADAVRHLSGVQLKDYGGIEGLTKPKEPVFKLAFSKVFPKVKSGFRASRYKEAAAE